MFKASLIENSQVEYIQKKSYKWSVLFVDLVIKYMDILKTAISNIGAIFSLNI